MLSNRILKFNKYAFFTIKKNLKKVLEGKTFCEKTKLMNASKKKTKTSLISEDTDKFEGKNFQRSTIQNDSEKVITNKTKQSDDSDTSSNIAMNGIKNKKSWKLFFNSQSKVLPDFNRAIKNNPDNEFFEFYDDMRNHFNERQFMFLIKNIYINKPSSLNTVYTNKINEIIKSFVSNYLNESAINFNSKVNLMMFLECLYLNTLKYQQLSLFETLHKANDYLRIFFKNFSFEEKVFTIYSMGRIGVFDFYLFNQMLKTNSKQLLEDFNNSYLINYYKVPVRMDLSIINVFARYIIYCQSTKQQFNNNNFENLVKEIIAKVENKIVNNEITVIDLGQEYKNFTKLFSVFEDKEQKEWETKINNIILEKNLNHLDKYLEESILNRDVLLFNSITETLREMKTNKYESSLYDKCFQQISFILLQSFKKENYENLASPTIELKDDIYLKTIGVYKLWVKDLCQISYDHNIFNPYIYQLYLILLDYGMKIENYDLLTQLYILNLHEYIKKYEVDPIYLKSYYSIINKLTYQDEKILVFYNKGLDRIRDKLKEFKDNYTPVSNSNKYYEALDSIYSKLTIFTPTQYIYDDHDLHYGKEINLENKISYIQNKLDGKLNMNIRPIFQSERINNSPSNNNAFDLIIEYLMVVFYRNLDLTYSLISQKICTQKYVKNILGLLNTIASTEHYDYIMKNIILRNKTYLEKLIIVINFILNPDPFVCKSSEELLKLVNCNIDENPENENNTSANESFFHNHLKYFDHDLHESLEGILNESTHKEIHEYHQKEIKEQNKKGSLNLGLFFLKIALEKNYIKLFFEKEDSTYYTVPVSIQVSDSKNPINHYVGLIKFYMDIKKITHTIDFVLMKNEPYNLSQHCKNICDSNQYYNEQLLVLPSEDLAFTSSCRNLSNLTVHDIICSDVFIEFINESTSSDIDTSNLKKIQIPNKAISNYSVFPYVAELAFDQSGNNSNIDTLVISKKNSQFKFSFIENSKLSNKINFLKTQFKTIYLLSD